MKQILLPLLFCLFSLSCSAQYFSYNKGGTSAKNYYEEIPYEEINGKLIVQVSIDGKTHKFLFDTGAPAAVSKKLATGYRVMLKDNITDVNGIQDSILVVEPKSIKLGNIDFNNVPALILTPAVYKCWDVEGVIGSNLLRNSIVQINEAKHIIILTDQPGKLLLNDKKSIPLVLDTIQSNPLIKVFTGNRTDMTLVFDTGDEVFLRLSEYFMDALKSYKVYQIADKGYGANGIGGFGYEKDNEKYLLKFPFVKIADTRFENVSTSTVKNGIPGIGAKLLKFGIVTLDYINHKFYFDSSNKIMDMTEKYWPFEPTIIGNRLTIGLIWDKGKKLVKLDEQIMDIDGISYATVNFCDFIDKKPVLSGKEKANFTIKSATGELRNVVVIKDKL